MDQVYTAPPTTRRPVPNRKSQSEKNRLESQLGEDYPSAVTLHLHPMCKLTPSVGTLGVSLLESLLDGLFRVGSLSWLLESIVGDGSLQRFELELVSGREEMGIVDDLDERLDLGSSSNLLLSHRLGHL